MDDLKDEFRDKIYSKEDFLEFCSNLVYGFDMDKSIDGIYGVSKRFDSWIMVFKNKK